MIHVILALLAIVAALAFSRVARGLFRNDAQGGFPAWTQSVILWTGYSIAGLFALWQIVATSIVLVPANSVGVVRKIYGFANLREGRLIATNGETGYQSAIVPPGAFRVSLLFNVLNTIEILPVVVVPNGFYGRIVARDGEPLPPGQIMAGEWPEQDFGKFLDAEYFLKNGGQKGLQLSVLKPGAYPLNLALFEVKIGYQPNAKDIVKISDDVYDLNGHHVATSPLATSITRVPAGYVGVVRSSVQSKDANCTTITAKTEADGLVAELVPQGCKGVWSTSLSPNDYYLNRDAYDVTLVSTRVTTLEFKGGFMRRYLDLKVDGKGDFAQSERVVNFAKPDDAADSAINTKVEGWEIQQELRAIVQITPENAPIVVAAVGGQKEVDERIVVPSIRSIVRNVFGGLIQARQLDEKGVPTAVMRQTRVLDTIEHRPELEEAILALAVVDGRRAGVAVKEIRLGESSIPPELLLARQREQLAQQLKLAYVQEQIAQTQRQQTEQARATADQQSELVRAQIAVQTAKLEQEKRQAQGHAERLFLEEQAAGQTAQSNVLGKDSVLLLQQFKLVTEMLSTHPELVKNLTLPQVFVAGGGGLDSAAAIFGALAGKGQIAPNFGGENALPGKSWDRNGR